MHLNHPEISKSNAKRDISFAGRGSLGSDLSFVKQKSSVRNVNSGVKKLYLAHTNMTKAG